MVATQTLVPEVLPTLRIGTIVRLPCGMIAEVSRSTHREVTVMHGDVLAAGGCGAGPWIFARHQVEEASSEEARDYLSRIATAKARTLQWIPVIAMGGPL